MIKMSVLDTLICDLNYNPEVTAKIEPTRHNFAVGRRCCPVRKARWSWRRSLSGGWSKRSHAGPLPTSLYGKSKSDYILYFFFFMSNQNPWTLCSNKLNSHESR